MTTQKTAIKTGIGPATDAFFDNVLKQLQNEKSGENQLANYVIQPVTVNVCRKLLPALIILVMSYFTIIAILIIIVVIGVIQDKLFVLIDRMLFPHKHVNKVNKH